MSDKPKLSLPTDVVHAAEERPYPYDAVAPPIVQTATYSFANTAELVAYMEGRTEREEYGRYGNPTVRLVENKLAILEGGEAALAFSSGMAAVTAVLFALCKQGSHVVLFADCYRRSRQFVGDFLGRFGVSHTLVPAADLEAMERAIRPETVLVVSEVPTNPYLAVVDLDRLVEICRKRRVKTLIDATFATPVNLRPLSHGADLVLHSASKYLSGHNDVLAGLVAGKSGLVSLVRDVRDVLGAVCDPHAAFLVHRGIKTLAMRVVQQNNSAQAIAEMLQADARVDQVWYPGLPSHPHHALAKRLMLGFGGVVTFTLAADGAKTSAFIDRLALPRIAPSFGGVESLVEQPALMSYFDQTPEQRIALGIPDNLVRYAVGIESTQDLIDDIQQALDA